MANPTFVSDVEWEEHDKTFGVKKVSQFVDNGSGSLVRQTKIATEAKQDLQQAVLDKFTFDVDTLDPITIDHVHSELHEGNDYYFQENITLNTAGVQDYLLTTGSSKEIHLIHDVDFLFVTQLQIFEGADRTGTTPQTIFNRNRASTNTSTVTIHKGTSGGTTDGVVIKNYKTGLSAGNGANRIASGGGASGRAELILKPNTKYIIRITSSTDSNIINTLLDWYEI